jgi:T3SS EscN ATPase C-terminal domain
VIAAGQSVRTALAMLREKEDLISIGAYRPGTDPALDAALAHKPRIDAFLRQRVSERSDPAESDAALLALADSLYAALAEHGEPVLDGEPVEAAPQVAIADNGPAAIPALRL